MGKIILYLLPLLVELKSMTQSTSNMAQDTSFAVQNVKEAMRSLIATAFAAFVLSGLVIFASIRLIERLETFVRTYEGGDNFLIAFYVALVLFGAGFVAYLFKSTSTPRAEAPKIQNNSASPGLESILGALVTGFVEGLNKQTPQTQEPTYSPEGSDHNRTNENKGASAYDVH